MCLPPGRHLKMGQEETAIVKVGQKGRIHLPLNLRNALAQRVVDSKGNDLATKVVRLIQNGGFEPTTSQKRAREIMGKNFFGVEEAIKHFGVNPTRQQLAALSEIPFSEAVLEQSKDTHILVAVFPLSILEIRGKVERKLFYNHEMPGITNSPLPRSMAKSTGNSFVRPQWTTRLRRTGKSSKHSSARTTKCLQLKRWSTPLLATSWPLVNGCSNENMPVHLLWIRTATVSASATSVRMVSVSATTGMPSATTMRTSRLLGSSES